MRETSEWEARCAALGDTLLSACKGALPDAELRLEDRTVGMLAQEDDPNVVPFHPIGNIYQLHVRERRTRYLFGWKRLAIRRWATLVSFSMEEMWDAPRWTAEQGIRCYVPDGRVAPAVMPILERFANDYGLLFRAAWSQKDP